MRSTVLAILFAWACSDPAPPVTDASTVFDASLDSSLDASLDTAADSGDMSQDGGFDSGEEDGGSDATPPDAGASVIDPTDFGELGMGNDTAILSEAYNAAIDQNKPLDLGGHLYVLTPGNVVNVFGRDTYFAIEIRSNTRIIGRDATIQLVDDFSTDEAPKQFSLFLTDQDTENFYIEDVTFDLNGRNNLLSPNRNATNPEGELLPVNQRYNSWIGDGLAWVKARTANVEIIRCDFINGAANTSILVSWSTASDAHLSNNVLIKDCVFRNNGFDVYDYSSINTYADNTTVEGCTFEQPHSVSLPTAFDSHGTNAVFRNNRVLGGFGRGVIAGSNYTAPVTNIVIEDNVIDVTGVGVLLFVNPMQTELGTVFVRNNTIRLRGGVPTLGSYRMGVSMPTARGGSGAVEVSNNSFSVIGPRDKLTVGVLYSNGEDVTDPTGEILCTDNNFGDLTMGLLSRQDAYATPVTGVRFFRNSCEALEPYLAWPPIGIKIRGDAVVRIPYVEVDDNTFYSSERGIDLNEGIARITIGSGNRFLH